MMCALRRVLKEARKLGMIDAESYAAAVDLPHMTPQAVLLIVQKRANQASVDSFSPHDFRRTFCSDLLDAGVDIVTVQKLAGHASPVTTAKYDRRGEETKRLAVQRLGF